MAPLLSHVYPPLIPPVTQVSNFITSTKNDSTSISCGYRRANVCISCSEGCSMYHVPSSSL
jgi:hypothetical protein